MAYEDDLNKAIGLRLQLVRREKNITQGQLSGKLRMIGMPLAQQTIAKIENGSRPLKLAEAEAISTILDIGVADLIPSEDRTEDVFELTEGIGRFVNSLTAIAISIREAKQHQRNALRLWGSASEETRRAFLAQRGVSEETVTGWLSNPVTDMASMLVNLRLRDDNSAS